MSDIPTELGEKMAREVRARTEQRKGRFCPRCVRSNTEQIDENKAGTLYRCNDCGAEYIV